MGSLIPTCFFAIATLAPPASSQVTYLTQARAVSATAPGAGPIPGESFTNSAPDFGRFAQTVAATGPLSSANGVQDSTLAANGIVATFSAFGNGPSTAAAFGSSLLNVTFSIAQPTPYSLIGQYSNVVIIEFTTLAGGVIYQTPSGSGSGSPNLSGVLPAGSYRYNVRCFGSGGSTGAPQGTASLSLLVPAPGTVGALALFGVVVGTRRRR